VTAFAIPSSPRREREGAALCVTTAATFAASVILAKLAYAAGANVSSVLAPRFAIAALVLWLIAARRGVARVPRRDALIALALGLFLYSSETELLYASLTRLDASFVELLAFAYPAIVMVGGLLLGRESPSRRRIAALGVASGGVVLVLGGAATGAAAGAVWLAMPLLTAAIFATYVLAVETLTGRLHPLALGALVCSGAAIAFTLGGSVSGSLHLGMPAAAWGWTLAIAFGATALPLCAFLAGVTRIGSSRASIIAMLEPPLAIVGAFVVFGERLGPLQLLGGALVLGAAVLVQLPERDRPAGPAAPSDPGGYDPPSRQRRATRSNRSNARLRAPGSALAASRRRRASSTP
jgi:drug/metabolite transporter (DMT)-like permease